MNYMINIIRNILFTLYQYFAASLLISVLFMFVFIMVRKQGWKSACREWFQNFKKDVVFQRTFFLVLYTAMLLFRTLLCRNLWLNPLSNVIGIWGFHDAKGKLYTENIENLLLFVPFLILFLLAGKSRILKKGRFLEVIWKSAAISFVFSLGIEFLQLFLRVGTFQLTDLVFNTLGGICGGIIYYIGMRIKENLVE